MDNLRAYTTMPPFEYKGLIMSAFLYTKGNSDLIHSFDVVTKGYNVSKLSPIDRYTILGITEEDMVKLRIRVQSYIDFKEGRKP
jgi:hypothetical protein